MKWNALIKSNLIEKLYNLQCCEDDLKLFCDNLKDSRLLQSALLEIMRKINFSNDNPQVYLDYFLNLSKYCYELNNIGENIDFYGRNFLYYCIYKSNRFSDVDRLDLINKMEKYINDSIGRDMLIEFYYEKLNILLDAEYYNLDEIVDTNAKLKSLIH